MLSNNNFSDIFEQTGKNDVSLSLSANCLMFLIVHRKNVSHFRMLGKTPCFPQILNSNRNGLIIDDPHVSIILREMLSYP